MNFTLSKEQSMGRNTSEVYDSHHRAFRPHLEVVMSWHYDSAARWAPRQIYGSHRSVVIWRRDFASRFSVPSRRPHISLCFASWKNRVRVRVESIFCSMDTMRIWPRVNTGNINKGASSIFGEKFLFSP